MSAEVREGKLNKVDSAVDDAVGASKDGKDTKHRRASSTAGDVYNLADLEKEGKEIKIAAETQRLNWKMNTSPSTCDDPAALKKLLCTPAIKKVDLHFPLGLEVTARNLKGVTIKDALDAIHKQFKKKADDELEDPYLAGFEWSKDNYTKFMVHQKKTGDAPSGGGKKKKAKGGDDE